MRKISGEMMFKVQCSGFKVSEGKMLISFFARYACVAILSIAVLAGFSEVDSQPSQLIRVRIGLAGRNFSFLPFFIAEQQKILRARGNHSGNDLHEVAGSHSCFERYNRSRGLT